MTDRALARAARIAMGVVLLAFVAGGVLAWVNVPVSGSEWGDSEASAFLFPLLIMPFPAVGYLIASRQPRNSIGWLMLGIGLVTGLSGILDGYVRYGLATDPGSLPFAEVGLALTAGSWVLVIVPIMTFLILLFPDGRAPSPRWRSVGYLSAGAMVGTYLVITVIPGTFEDVGYPGVENPLGIEALRPVKDLLLSVLILIPIAVLGCAAGLVQRFRRSRGQERLQLKWLATAATVVALVYALAMVATLATDAVMGKETPAWVSWLQGITVPTFVLIPIAIGIAVLRHRLYNIDRLINRTLVYAGLTGVLTVAYLLLVTVLQILLGPLAGTSELTVAMSTLAIAALFRPALSRVQAFIDRRFYRSKYDAAHTLEEFVATIRNEVDLEALSPALVRIVHATMQPSHVSLWLHTPEAQPEAPAQGPVV